MNSDMETYKIISIPVALIILALPFFFKLYAVQGDSMYPELKDSDVLVIDNFSFRFVAPKLGEVIMLHNPHRRAEIIVKRVIGLPGETVHVGDTDVTITHKDGTREVFGKETSPLFHIQ